MRIPTASILMLAVGWAGNSSAQDARLADIEPEVVANIAVGRLLMNQVLNLALEPDQSGPGHD